MGRDKAGLTVSGETFLERAVKNLKDAEEILLSVRSTGDYPGCSLKKVENCFPDAGPAAGIHAALKVCRCQVLFAVGCDMPCVDLEFAEDLSQYLGEEIDAVIPKDRDGRLYVLGGLYHKRCAAAFEKALAGGERKVRNILKRLNVAYVPFDQIRNGEKKMQNINTPEEYCAAVLNAADQKQTEIPVISFVAYSGTGKTTFLEKLIPELKKRGLRVGVLKHDAHNFEIDREGKDSWRITQAGADVTALISSERAAIMENRPADPEEILKKITNVDIILTEGYKTGSWPKIMLYRSALGKPMPLDPGICLAVVSDAEVRGARRRFGLEDYKGVADLLEDQLKKKRKKYTGGGGGRMDEISIERAQKMIREAVFEAGCEMVPAEECAGRILGEDLVAAMTQPPFPRSAMDGYAVRAEDVRAVSEESPAVLNVSGCVFAGGHYAGRISPGEAVRIMTGAPVPEGADCIVRQEDTDLGADQVRIYRSARSGESICPAGEDFITGELLAPKGSTADAYTVSCAVAAGLTSLKVRKRPRAAVITTGDELRRPGTPLGPGQIYNSSMAYLTVRLQQMGCTVSLQTSAGDSVEAICRAAEEAAECSDVIITTGGVSVGEKDLMPEVLEKLRADIVFKGMDIKPGMPTVFSLISGIPVLSLSGNPYSAFAVFELLFPVLLAKMSGRRGKVFVKKKVRAGDSFSKPSPVRRIIRGRYDADRVYFSGSQGNGQLKGGIGTNCLIEIEEGNTGVSVGDELTVILTV